MKQKFLLILMAVLTLGYSPARAAEDPEFKDGYYLLKSADDMVFFASLVNSGDPNNYAKAKLIADIDMSGVNFFPIGMYANSGGTQVCFKGHFDGQGHIIYNLYQEAYDYYELGLFSRAQSCTIENLGIVNAKIIQHRGIRTGVLAGLLYQSTVRNCFTAGNIEVQSILDEGAETIGDANYRVGGIGGEQNAVTLQNCYTTFKWLCDPTGNTTANVNCFAGEELADDAGNIIVPAATPEMLASGEICAKLNTDPNNIRWYQTLGEDAFPVQDATHKRVYAHGDILCNGAPAEGGNCTYSNEAPTSVPDHSFGDDGLCEVCGTDIGYFTPAEDGWYEVTDGNQLRYVSRVATSGNNGIGIRLMNDIDLIDIANFPPIGYWRDGGTTTGFRGVFDGQNHIISNLTVYVDDGQEAGLFGRVHSGGTLKNFGIVNADITNGAAIRAGIVAGEIHVSTVNNVFTAGVLNITTDHAQKGGISGEAASSTLNNCYSTFDGPIANAPGTLNNCFGGNDAIEMAPTGKLCWRLNGKTFRNPTYYQTLDEDEFPVLDSTHGLVYKVGDGEFKSARTAEEFQELVNTMIAGEKAGLEDMKASANLITTYEAELSKLEGLSYEEFLTAFDALGALREALSNSEAAYKAYMDKVAEVKEYLATHDDFGGEDRDILQSYLTEEFAAGESELYPNGSYSTIIEACALNNNVIKQETAFVQQMLETAIANGYMPGSDITKKLVNPDFADGLNGWTITGHLEASGDYGNTHARLIRDYNGSLQQTLTDMKPGVYEFQMNSYSELGDWTQPATYNYTSFITGNGVSNYGKPQGAELMSEETYETLTDDEKSHLRAIMDETEYEVVKGYKPGDLTGVAIMMDRGVWNNRILAVVGEDGVLTVGMNHEGFKSRRTDLFVANARLRYLGETGSDGKSDALDDLLADMVTAANHIVYDYVADYYANGATDAPNFTKSLAEELKAAVAAVPNAADNAAKYEIVKTFSDIFQRIWESKKLYAELAQLNESVMKTCEDVLGDDPTTFNKFVAETYEPNIDVFEKGEATNAEVEAKIEELRENNVYKLQQGEEPELVDGFYQITNAYNLIWFSNQSNNNGKNGGNSLNAVLMNDIDMTPAGNFTPIALHRDDVDWDGDGANDGVGIGTVYSGIFDGQGHVIKNLKVIHYDGCEAGLFSRCQAATVRNLGFENAHIENLRTYADGTAGIRAGVLAGEFYRGMLENCWSTGNIVIETIHSQRGGLCGEAAQSTLRGCWTTFEAVAYGAGSMQGCFGGLDVEDLGKTGALCFLLNVDQETISWYQNIGEDKYPVLDASHKQVYQHGGLFCDGSPKPETTFDNVESEYVVDAHDFDEDGICKACGYDGGTISPVDGWFNIDNVYQLRWFAKYVNAGNTGVSARLTSDIDLENKPFFPIGIYSDAGSYQGYGNCAYTGTFDGQGHIVKNLYVEGSGNVELGFFSRTSGATVRNLGLVNATVINTHPNDGKRVGALAGEAHNGNYTNCFVTGNIDLQTTHSQKGGMAGEAASGKFYNCYTTYETFSNQGSFDNCFGKKQIKDANGNVIIAAIPDGALESGELCFAINKGEFTTPTWFQTLGEDKYPILDNTHKIVYRNDDGTYTNERKGLAAYDGTEENPFRIETVEQFTQLIDYMKPGQMNYVVLENDLDMDNVTTWIPINCDQAVAGYANYIHFDGQNHVIKNFHPTNTGQSYQSIFGIMCGTVKNLGVENADVNCPNSGTGILCAWIGRTATYDGISYVDHCWVTGKLNCGGYAGAISGHIEGEAYVRNCYANADITSTSTVTGGIIGRVRGKLQMENVYAAGSHNHGGGIIGGGQQAATPACTYNNIVVWNNYFENFGETAIADKMSNISYYNNTNFAELQKTVVAWDSSVWSCGMGEGEYPVLIGSGATGLAMPKLIIDNNAVYTLTGVKVGNDLKKLPKGIYIVNGKKVLVK